MAALKEIQFSCKFDFSKPDLNGQIYSPEAVKKACEDFKSKNGYVPVIVKNVGSHFELGKTTSMSVDEENKTLEVEGILNAGGTIETCKVENLDEGLNVNDISFEAVSFIAGLPTMLPREEN